MTPALYAACQSAVHVITAEGRVLSAGRASIFVLEHIGFPVWLVRPFTWPPLVWLTEGGYRLVADHRRFFGKIMFRRDPG
jgi:predicted DCC family thiol-disulfide oxidoreductase YuxK